jgi:amidohydrolase
MTFGEALDASAVETIRREIGVNEPALRDLRRDIHSHPETAWEEVRTTSLVTEQLTRMGLVPHILGGETGAVADVVGDPSGPLVALRADLDALPLDDLKVVPYRSKSPGVTHACGHDVHTSALIGAAHALQRLAQRGQLPGRVRLLFQPAEEVIPGGALRLLESGALEEVRRVFALHCDPHLEVGRLAVRPGPITAAVDSVFVELTGPGGHSARPHLTSDLIGALSDVISRLPTVLSRRVDPRADVSMMWGCISAGSSGNIIPSRAEALGNVRVSDPRVWKSMEDLIPQLIRQIASPYEADVKIRYTVGLPPAFNDPECTASVRRAAESVLGLGRVDETPRSMGGGLCLATSRGPRVAGSSGRATSRSNRRP